jgi:hypothetical protein
MNMRFLTLIILCLSATSSRAQKTVDVTKSDVSAMSPAFFNVVGGEPFVFAKFTRLVEGSPYFNDNWMKGNVVINGGGQYSGIYLKLDLYDNEVHFQDQKGNEMIATIPIQKVFLVDTAAQRVYNFINGEFIQANSRVKGWYQLLSEGKALLLKKFNKQMQEFKPFGSATVEQSIITSSRYYILSDGKFTEIKKIKEIAGILIDKKTEITQYVKSNNLPGKTDPDFITLINYYNQLK